MISPHQLRAGKDGISHQLHPHTPQPHEEATFSLWVSSSDSAASGRGGGRGGPHSSCPCPKAAHACPGVQVSTEPPPHLPTAKGTQLLAGLVLSETSWVGAARSDKRGGPFRGCQPRPGPAALTARGVWGPNPPPERHTDTASSCSAAEGRKERAGKPRCGFLLLDNPGSVSPLRRHSQCGSDR